MGIILWIIFGGIAGWLASILMNTDHEQGVFGNIAVGVVGALIGGFVFELFGGEGVTGFNLYSLVVALIGSAILLAILKSLRGANRQSS